MVVPLLEFTVPGPPVSQLTKDKPSLRAWRDVIRAAAAAIWGGTLPLVTQVQCTIINFHEGHQASLDDDNMVKPIRDALNKLVYLDDRQITTSETRQVCIDAPLRIRRASAVLLAAFATGEEFVYIRIDDAPQVIQLPQ
jgi:hypothetical protein